MYRSLGCFHSLQPSTNPFETPSIPSLLPTGFVRWQTVQLLLCPDEHVPYLQETLKRYDIVNPATGTTFPKTLPRTAFAEFPDKEMTAWHDEITRRLEKDRQNIHISASPLPSPKRGRDDRRDYFVNEDPGRHSSRPSRANSREQVLSYDGSRRSSLPEHNIPPHLNGYQRYASVSNSMGDMRFQHGQRTSQATHEHGGSSSRLREVLSGLRRHRSSSRQRTSTNGLRPESVVPDGFQDPGHRVRHRHSATANSSPVEPLNNVRRHRSTTMNSSSDQAYQRPRPRSPTGPGEVNPSSGSDASSETSSPTQMFGKRRSSLFPPSSFTPRHHHRRDSSDPVYRAESDNVENRPPLPPRPAHAAKKQYEYPRVPPSSYKYVPGPRPVHKMEPDIPLNGSPSGAKPRGGGLFENVPWDNSNKGVHPASTSASPPNAAYASAPLNIPGVRYPDPKRQVPAEFSGKWAADGLPRNPAFEGVTPIDHRRNSVPAHLPSLRHVPGRGFHHLNPNVNSVPVGTATLGTSPVSAIPNGTIPGFTRSRRNSRSNAVFD